MKGERGSVLPRNPLQLEAAVVFAIVLTIVLVLTQLIAARLGKGGTYTFAAVMGVADVDPFVLGLTQTAGKVTPFEIAAASVFITAASNNLAKGVYALLFAKDRAGRLALGALAGLAIAGLVPLFFL